MTQPIDTYIIILSVIVLVGQIFRKSVLPLSLLLVITGMLLSNVPWFPNFTLNPELVLNVFLPILIYQISAFSSWKDFKKYFRPIALLSIGHVFFITILVAVIIHFLIPQLGWPLSFLIGAVISPPDDVAIVAIAEKVEMPEGILTVLEGEAMFNDATALILFRFALLAVVTHEFSIWQATGYYFAALIGETIYGLLVGFVIGGLRTKILNSKLHMIASLLTPFIAYLPPERLGGSGILATAITGFIIGNNFTVKFQPNFRLFSRSVWPTISFIIQNFLFLMIGLNLKSVLQNISTMSKSSLIIYSVAVVATIILGRFIWVFSAIAYLPRVLFPWRRRKTSYLPWQYPFLVSWAGMRGAISLAAAFAVPTLPILIEGANPRDLIIFLVFSAIVATLIVQGLSLPWLIKKIGLLHHGQLEKYSEHLRELKARLHLTKVALRWLKDYKEEIKDDEKLLNELKVSIQQYRLYKVRLKDLIADHDQNTIEQHDEQNEALREISLLGKLIEVEREELLRLWHEEKINLAIRNRLLDRLDHRISLFQKV